MYLPENSCYAVFKWVADVITSSTLVQALIVSIPTLNGLSFISVHLPVVAVPICFTLKSEREVRLRGRASKRRSSGLCRRRGVVRWPAHWATYWDLQHDPPDSTKLENLIIITIITTTTIIITTTTNEKRSSRVSRVLSRL
jgi:hypothetical protein